MKKFYSTVLKEEIVVKGDIEKCCNNGDDYTLVKGEDGTYGVDHSAGDPKPCWHYVEKLNPINGVSRYLVGQGSGPDSSYDVWQDDCDAA